MVWIAGLRFWAVLLEFNSGSLCQNLKGAAKVDAVHFHREVKNVAMQITNPAAIPLPNRIHRKAGLFVRVPRAESHVVCSHTAQVDPAADKINNVGSLFDAVFYVEVGADRHRCSVESNWKRPLSLIP